MSNTEYFKSFLGLLQLNTAPRGIFFPYGYISGTKDSVTGYYSDSCCNPDLQITAVDRMNNRNSYSVNAYRKLFPIIYETYRIILVQDYLSAFLRYFEKCIYALLLAKAGHPISCSWFTYL